MLCEANEKGGWLCLDWDSSKNRWVENGIYDTVSVDGHVEFLLPSGKIEFEPQTCEVIKEKSLVELKCKTKK